MSREDLGRRELMVAHCTIVFPDGFILVCVTIRREAEEDVVSGGGGEGGREREREREREV